MSTEGWALAGVVMGALLGGLAQVLNEWLRAGRDREKVRRDERRAAYALLLTCAVHSSEGFAMAADSDLMSPQTDATDHAARLDAADTSTTELLAALAVVELVAPGDTHHAALELFLAEIKLSHHRLAQQEPGRGAACDCWRAGGHEKPPPGAHDESQDAVSGLRAQQPRLGVRRQRQHRDECRADDGGQDALLHHDGHEVPLPVEWIAGSETFGTWESRGVE